MLKNIGLKNGTVFVQGIYREGRFYFMEAGLRLSGTTPYRFISKVNTINVMEMLVNYALTGEMGLYDLNLEDPFLHGSSCCILNLINSGGDCWKYFRV